MRPKICIAHQSVMYGDAVGNDIAGAYRLLERCGYEVAIVCEYVHAEVQKKFRVLAGPDAAALARGFGLLLYHHSIHWPAGEELLQDFAGPVVVKYHNITPAHYFAPYVELYREKCDEGRRQTSRMVGLPGIARWHSDSSFNSLELRELGVAQDLLAVVPPFNRITGAFCEVHEASYDPGRTFTALFVGRRAPNKGHAHLLRTAAAWRELFPGLELKIRILGVHDPALDSYDRELRELERSLGLAGRIEWLGHLKDEELTAAFRSSHLYLNLSEHEGFCLPLIEAQAIGLPTISSSSSALPDTAGSGQLLFPVTGPEVDYDLIAGMAREVCTSAGLRDALVSAGCKNVYQRFTSISIECCFMDEMAPALAMLES
jgi:glycosyltransferase involved in cell wall biosynthesis